MATDANGNPIPDFGILNEPQVTPPPPSTAPPERPNTSTAPPAPPNTSTAPPAPLNTGTPMPWDVAPPVATAPPAAQATPGLIGPVSTLDPNAMSTAVDRVTDPNSAISQRATAVANEQSNASGLLNSSMAVGAARNAVLNAALPIAQGDVGAQEQNAQQTNAMHTAQAQMTTGVNTSNTAAQNAQIMSQLDQTNKVQLAGINAKFQNALTSNQNANGLYTNYMQQISTIQNNPNMDAVTKSTAIAQLVTQLQGGLSNMSAISGLNLGAGLDFSGMNGVAGANTDAAKAKAAADIAAIDANNALTDAQKAEEKRLINQKLAHGLLGPVNQLMDNTGVGQTLNHAATDVAHAGGDLNPLNW